MVSLARAQNLLQTIDDALSFIDECIIVSNEGEMELDGTIIILNGTVGVGKTSTSDALNGMIKNCIFLDGDALYQHSSLNHTNCKNWYKNWISIICTNINLHFNKFNTTNFVISYVFEDEESIINVMNAFLTLLHYKHFSIYYFLLDADINIISNRIKKRAMYLYDNDDIESLKWDLNRAKELQHILLNNHQHSPHCIGQLIDTSNIFNIKQAANKIKSIIMKYKYNLSHCLEVLDFLDEFKNIIINRKKCATTRWLKGESFKVNLKANKWMIATIDNGKKPFGIIHINKIETYQLNEINDKIAKIENMQTGKQLINLLKKIYKNINDSDTVQVVYFTYCHFVSNKLMMLESEHSN